MKTDLHQGSSLIISDTRDQEPGSFWREKKANTNQSKGLRMRGTLDFSSSNRQKTMNRAVRILSQNINQKQRQNRNLFRLTGTQEIIFQLFFLGKSLENVLQQNEGIKQENQAWDPGKTRGSQEPWEPDESGWHCRNKKDGVAIGLHMALKT